MSGTCAAPIPIEELVAYHLGELAQEDEARVETHYFGCASCTRRLEAVAELKEGIVRVVRRGLVSASVTADLVERGVARGLEVRTYRLGPGERVACTAAPTDDFVAIRLGVGAHDAGSADLAVEWTALDTGATEDRSMRELAVDPSTGEVVLLFSGQAIRQVPRSQWRMEAVVHGPAGTRRVGPYTLDHTPWDQLK